MENKQAKNTKEEPIVTMEAFMEKFQKFRSELEVIHNRKSNDEIDVEALNNLFRQLRNLERDIKKL